MWDYNVGLVRMTPFFKCCKYSKVIHSSLSTVAEDLSLIFFFAKTTPAKMLNMNPGLKEITHSITGGSIMAQGKEETPLCLCFVQDVVSSRLTLSMEGYWMPFDCAKAVCATFCYRIAGALIPIFGEEFPSMCIPPDAPEHGRMIIDPTIVLQSTREADHFRRFYSNMVTSTSGGGGLSPNSRDHHHHRHQRRPIRLGGYDDAATTRQHQQQYPRLRVRRPFVSSENPYGIDTDGEVSPATDRGLHDRFVYSPIQVLTPLRPPTSSWTSVNNPNSHSHPHPSHHHHHYDAVPPPPPPPPSHPHNHWLSAVPRLGSPQPYHHVAPPAMHTPSPAIYHHHHHHSHMPHMAPFTAPPIKRHQQPPVPLPQRGPPRKRSAEHLDHEHSEVFRILESSRKREEVANSSPHSHSPTLFTPFSSFSSLKEEKKKPITIEAAAATATPLHGPEKKAALLLMNLSVRDTVARSNGGRPGGGVASASTSPMDVTFPRKRQRANSM